MSDAEIRKLERLAAQGDSAAAAALGRARARLGPPPRVPRGPHGGPQTWHMIVAPSILGPILRSARRHGGRWLHGHQIPSHVQWYMSIHEGPYPHRLVLPPHALEVVQQHGRARPGGLLLFTATDVLQPRPRPQPPEFAGREEESFGDEENRAYYAAVRATPTSRIWWAMVLVNAPHFSDRILARGGFTSRRSALELARNTALEWCYINGVPTGDPALDVGLEGEADEDDE